MAAAASSASSFPYLFHRSDAGSATAAAAALSSSSCSSCLVLRSFSQRKPGAYPAIRATSSSPMPPPQQKTTTTTPVPASPVRTAEDLVSRLDLAVAGLERLFSSPSHSPLAPVPVPATVGGGGCDDRPHPDPSPRRPLRVAYQGPPGSYSHEAAAAAFASLPSSHLAAFPCAHMEDAFAALEDGAADRAVVPAENSLDGPIHRNLDLLLRHPRVEVVGELVLPVNHCLLALPGASLPAVRRVASHPQALAHCRSRLAALGVETEEAPNPAEAARALAEGRLAPRTAVVGSRAAAEEFGLVVLVENLQDAAAGGNHTRFLQLALRRPEGSPCRQVSAAGLAKATVALALERGPSELFRAMWAFESRGLAVTRVDHRPKRKNPVRFVERAGERVGYFDYVFVLDVELAGGSVRVDPVELDSAVESAVERLREICGFVRVLGSYARVTAC